MKRLILFVGLIITFASSCEFQTKSDNTKNANQNRNQNTPLEFDRNWIVHDLNLIAQSNQKFKAIFNRLKWVEVSYPLQNLAKAPLRFSLPSPHLNPSKFRDLRLFAYVFSEPNKSMLQPVLIQYEVLSPRDAKLLELNRMMPVQSNKDK